MYSDLVNLIYYTTIDCCRLAVSPMKYIWPSFLSLHRCCRIDRIWSISSNSFNWRAVMTWHFCWNETDMTSYGRKYGISIIFLCLSCYRTPINSINNKRTISYHHVILCASVCIATKKYVARKLTEKHKAIECKQITSNVLWFTLTIVRCDDNGVDVMDAALCSVDSYAHPITW